MTIRKRLTLNVLFVSVIVGAVVVTGILGMWFVKSKLTYLTEQSTPFQMRTLDFQRALQGATADLVKVGASDSKEGYALFRKEAERSLAEVKSAQEALRNLSGESKTKAYEELEGIASEMFAVTQGRLDAEDQARSANKTITQRLREVSAKLKDLDSRIKHLQGSRTKAFGTSVEDTKNITSKLRSVETFKAILKDLQIAVMELQRSQDRKTLIIARGKINAIMSKAIQNDHVKESKNLVADMKSVGEKIEELIRLQGQVNGESKGRIEALQADVNEKVSALLLMVEQDILTAAEKSGTEAGRQNSIFGQTVIANTVLSNTSEITAYGLTLEGLATRLFTVNSERELGSIEAELRRAFERIEIVEKTLRSALVRLDAKEEQKTLQAVVESVNSIKGTLFSGSGIIAKVRHQLAMKEKSLMATESLRDIVLKQAELGKNTITVARGDQENAIAAVNRVVQFSTLLIATIGVGALVFGILFGIWVYRSIAGPLNQLMQVSEKVAGGDLTGTIDSEAAQDEIGTVQGSMSSMVRNLRDIIDKLRLSTGSLASSSEELSATAVALEKGSRQQVLQIEQSATAMTQMSQTTIDMARNASDTAKAAQDMRSIAESGRNSMETTTKELVKFRDSVQESADRIEALGRKSGEIHSIVTLIKDIADQTNLLALNAAIEAARAGEQGRGFAVVADNVRQLAERSSQAAGEIGKTVQSIQEDVQSSVHLTQDERRSINKVMGHVDSNMKAIDHIVSYVGQVSDMVQRIAAAVEEQTTASQEVSGTMENTSLITRDLNNSVGEIKRSADELAVLAAELDEKAAWFKV
ncbi:MAG TPA: methyl-accepting chemotaxis protein [Dissulfurispiraceae bacterium]|nr:methyl-accepting chemotaxis protein [Dissulfurispiraceae bacterium]